VRKNIAFPMKMAGLACDEQKAPDSKPLPMRLI